MRGELLRKRGWGWVVQRKTAKNAYLVWLDETASLISQGGRDQAQYWRGLFHFCAGADGVESGDCGDDLAGDL